jgi:hypothetical protein
VNCVGFRRLFAVFVALKQLEIFFPGSVTSVRRDRKDRHRIEAGIETLQYFGE